MQSIYTTLDTLTTETSVPEVKDKNGNLVRKNMGMVPMELRREDWPTSEQFEDEAKLLQWCQEKGVLHQCLQSGISDRLIDYRAIFKAMPKKADLDAGVKWTVEFGQSNIDRAEWQVQKRPQTKKSAEEIAKEYLAQLSPAELKKFLSGK